MFRHRGAGGMGNNWTYGYRIDGHLILILFTEDGDDFGWDVYVPACQSVKTSETLEAVSDWLNDRRAEANPHQRKDVDHG